MLKKLIIYSFRTGLRRIYIMNFLLLAPFFLDSLYRNSVLSLHVLFFSAKQKVAELPGVGFSLNQKLKSLNVVSCMDLQRIPISVLRREFGQKTGDMLFKYCRGQDDRDLKIERERKSVSAEINYAIRLTQVNMLLSLKIGLCTLRVTSENIVTSNCANRKFSLCHVSIELITRSRLMSTLSDPTFFLTIFHVMFTG